MAFGHGHGGRWVFSKSLSIQARKVCEVALSEGFLQSRKRWRKERGMRKCNQFGGRLFANVVTDVCGAGDRQRDLPHSIGVVTGADEDGLAGIEHTECVVLQ